MNKKRENTNLSKIAIAVIDTGISDDYSQIISEKYEVIKEKTGTYSAILNSGSDCCGHGTEIINIINKTAEEDDRIDIISVKICDTKDAVDSKALTFALNYIFNNLNVNIINIGIGVTNIEDYEEMKSVCRKLKEKGVTIVSAFDDNGAISYPAAFYDVIGIDSYKEHSNSGITGVFNSIINVIFPANYYSEYKCKSEEIHIKGNSYVSAYFSSAYARYILGYENVTAEEYINRISSKTIKYCIPKPFAKPNYSINRAIVFPFNNDALTLFSMKDILSFELVGAYDNKLSDNIGKNIGEISVKAFEDIDWDGFDTLILSCGNDVKASISNDLIEIIEDKCLNNNINIYAYENIINLNNTKKINPINNYALYSYAKRTKIDDYKKNDHFAKSFYPQVSKDNVPYNNMGKLNKVNIPVIGVFGTLPKQQQYALQIDLLRSIRKKGYNPGFVTTEPSGYLLAADYTIHNGKGSRVEFTPKEYISLINDCLFNTQNKGKDMIVTGCFTPVIHYDNSNINDYCIEGYSVLLGTSPDYIIMCINQNEKIEYVDRMISCLNSAGKGKVFALVVSPEDSSADYSNSTIPNSIESSRNMISIKDYYMNHSNISTYIMGNRKDTEKIVENIINISTKY